MKIVRKQPGECPEVIHVENTLDALQAQVGGYIETVTFAEDACVICNEEGRLLGLRPNCIFLGVEFVGTILVVGIDGEDFTGLTEDQMEICMKIFGGK